MEYIIGGVGLNNRRIPQTYLQLPIKNISELFILNCFSQNQSNEWIIHMNIPLGCLDQLRYIENIVILSEVMFNFVYNNLAENWITILSSQ